MTGSRLVLSEQTSVRIEMTGPRRGRVWVGGAELIGVSAVSFRASVGKDPRVLLILAPSRVEVHAVSADVTAEQS